VTTFGTPPEDPQTAAAQGAQPSAPSAAGPLSPDGRWRWDGRQWQPVDAPAAPVGGAPQTPAPQPGESPVPAASPYAPPAGYAQHGQYGQAAMPTITAGPAPGLAYAGFWIRFVAYLIDWLIQLAVVFLLGAISGGIVRTDPVTGVTTVNGGLEALAFVVGIVYVVGFWAARSQTPGMMVLNLRIAREEDGGPLDLGRAAIRYLGYVIASLPFCLGLIWAGFDSRKQGWHDKIARTLVVRRY
jgi:uncharacterized RDD family membrane protein YckC